MWKCSACTIAIVSDAETEGKVSVTTVITIRL